MFRKRKERLESIQRTQETEPARYNRVSDHELFQLPGVGYNVVRVPKVN
jgi:hypothetical protein